MSDGIYGIDWRRRMTPWSFEDDASVVVAVADVVAGAGVGVVDCDYQAWA